jgi:hypothetical protein
MRFPTHITFIQIYFLSGNYSPLSCYSAYFGTYMHSVMSQVTLIFMVTVLGIPFIILEVCDDGTLVQILFFWILFIILSLSKNTVLFILQNNVILDMSRNITFALYYSS